MSQPKTVFKLKTFVTDQEKASELDLCNNCLLFYAAWQVFWQRSESENLIVLAKREHEGALVEMFQIESAKVQLPIGCGLVTICGEKSGPNNVCVFFRYSEVATDFESLLTYDGEMSDFVGVVMLSKKVGLAINDIIESVDA